LGTDSRGHDELAQLLHGIRTSLYIGVTASIIAIIIGVIVGTLSAIKGGIIDESLMLITNIVTTLPSILLMILIATLTKYRSGLIVAFIIGITSWPWVARGIRAQLMSLKTREFVFLSRMAGLGDLRISVEDLLPNMGSWIFMAFIMQMSGAMVSEAGLSMIGVGVTRGVSLGIMLFWAQIMEAIRRGLYWMFVPPGLCLVMIAALLLTIATTLDEYFNPRLRRA